MTDPTPIISRENLNGMHTLDAPTDRVVWVLHEPTNDRRTQRPIKLSDAEAIGGTVRVLLPATATCGNYTQAARALYDAWDDFEDGDVIVSMGGDLHTVSMVDDLLRQRGVVWYYWARHVGYGKYALFEKHLDATQFCPTLHSTSQD